MANNRHVTLLPKDQFNHESNIKPGSYGLHDTFRNGMSSVGEQSRVLHPLINSEKNYHKNKQQQEFATLRNTQGLHMPMKLQMERAILSRVQRLPGLQSSRISLRTTLCDDDLLGFEDMFDSSSQSMSMVDYRDLYEKQQGLV